MERLIIVVEVVQTRYTLKPFNVKRCNDFNGFSVRGVDDYANYSKEIVKDSSMGL